MQTAARVWAATGPPGRFHRQYVRTLAGAFAPTFRWARWRPEAIRPRLLHDPRASAAPRSKAPWRNGRGTTHSQGAGPPPPDAATPRHVPAAGGDAQQGHGIHGGREG